MPYHWPKERIFALRELDVLDRDCLVCGRRMYICDHRYRHFHTLEGPVWNWFASLTIAPIPGCPGHTKTKSPEIEATIAPPKLGNRLGRFFCWIGHDGGSRHNCRFPRSNRENLLTTMQSRSRTMPSPSTSQRYQVMLAARQQRPRSHLSADNTNQSMRSVVSIDGLWTRGSGQ